MSSPVRVYPEYIDPVRLVDRLHFVIEQTKRHAIDSRGQFSLYEADIAMGTVLGLEEMLKSIYENTY